MTGSASRIARQGQWQMSVRGIMGASGDIDCPSHTDQPQAFFKNLLRIR